MSEERVFISYAREDGDAVEGFRRAFEAANIQYWLDVEAIQPGQNFIAEINDAIRQCRQAVVFFSRQYMRKRWPTIELHALIGFFVGLKDRELLVVKLDDAELPPMLANLQYLGPTDAEKLVRHLKKGESNSGNSSDDHHPVEAKAFLTSLDGSEVEHLSAAIVNAFDRRGVDSADKPIRLEAALGGRGVISLETIDLRDSIIDELRGNLHLCEIHRRYIKGLNDELATNALGAFKPGFEIKLDERVRELTKTHKDLRDWLFKLLLKISCRSRDHE